MNLFSIFRKMHIWGRCGDTADEGKSRRRKALRAVESAIDLVKDKIAEIRVKRDSKLTEARNYCTTGQTPAARHALTEVRDIEIQMTLLERKRWLFETMVIRLESIETDHAFATALSELAKVITVDPERIAEALGKAAEKCDMLKDVEKAWIREYGQAENGGGVTAALPSVEEMMKDLEKSVANEKPELRLDRKDGSAESTKRVVDMTPTDVAEILRNIAKAMDGSGK